MKVMIGTPCFDGKLDVWYTNSLIMTLEESQKRNNKTQIFSSWPSYDPLVQRARNNLINDARHADVDALVFIDSDISWKPAWFFDLIECQEDVVGGTYPKKSIHESYVIHQTVKRYTDDKTGMLEVDGLGTGFVKLSKKAIHYLWDNSEPYIDDVDWKEKRNVFEVGVINRRLYGEDYGVFKKLREGGFKIWLDTMMVCDHTGTKKYLGRCENFWTWYNKMRVDI